MNSTAPRSLDTVLDRLADEILIGELRAALTLILTTGGINAEAETETMRSIARAALGMADRS